MAVAVQVTNEWCRSRPYQAVLRPPFGSRWWGPGLGVCERLRLNAVASSEVGGSGFKRMHSARGRSTIIGG
jgi:hypothetical protein